MCQLSPPTTSASILIGGKLTRWNKRQVDTQHPKKSCCVDYSPWPAVTLWQVEFSPEVVFVSQVCGDSEPLEFPDARKDAVKNSLPLNSPTGPATPGIVLLKFGTHLFASYIKY